MNEEMNDRITNVENMFGISGIPLKLYERRLVGEGILIKMCRKKPKQRYFFLFSDILVYGSIVIPKKKLTGQHIIELEDVEIKDLEDTAMPYFGFCVKSPKKSFAMYAISAEEKEQWITHMKKCINECTAKRGIVGLTAIKSPVWIPDAMAPKCMVCRLTVFSILNRRHHCRQCGIVVCSSCSEQRWLLPYQNNVPVRVCDTCYKQLQQGHDVRKSCDKYLPIKSTSASEDYISETSSEDSDYDEHQTINLLNLTNPNLSEIVE